MITRDILIFCSAWLLACGGSSADAKTRAPADPPDAVYDVRGRIEAIDSQLPDTTIQIAHEAIPSFKDRDGHPSAMPAMTMPFALDPRVARSSLSPKSLYQFRIEIHWSHAPGMRVVGATPLPQDTPLNLATH